MTALPSLRTARSATPWILTSASRSAIVATPLPARARASSAIVTSSAASTAAACHRGSAARSPSRRKNARAKSRTRRPRRVLPLIPNNGSLVFRDRGAIAPWPPCGSAATVLFDCIFVTQLCYPMNELNQECPRIAAFCNANDVFTNHVSPIVWPCQRRLFPQARSRAERNARREKIRRVGDRLGQTPHVSFARGQKGTGGTNVPLASRGGQEGGTGDTTLRRCPLSSLPPRLMYVPSAFASPLFGRSLRVAASARSGNTPSW